MTKVTTFEEALDRARAENRRIAIKVGAVWCGSCGRLARDVLETAQGRPILAELVQLDVDFDDPKMHDLVRRFAVLELPTLVVTDSNGAEIGRVLGYDGAVEWMRDARKATTDDDPMPALETAHARDPGDGAAALALGEALLARDPKRAFPLLELVAWRDDELAARALWLLGRYTQRVANDPQCRWIWQLLATRFPKSPHAADAHTWYARWHRERGQAALASASFASAVRREPDNAALVLEWSRLVLNEALVDALPELRAAAMKAIDRAPREAREELEALVMNLGRKKKPG